MGGNLCQDMAYYYPEKVKGLILIDCTRNTNKLSLWEKFGLKVSSFIFKIYPMQILINQSAKLCGNREYTINYIKRTMSQIGKARFIEIMSSLKQALHEDEDYTFHCPVLLI